MRTKTPKKKTKKSEIVNTVESNEEVQTDNTIANNLTEPIVLQLNLSSDKIENIISSKSINNKINDRITKNNLLKSI
mgnify:CR=1 FL=1